MKPDYDHMTIKEAARVAAMIEEREALEMDIKAGRATPEELFELMQKQKMEAQDADLDLPF